MRREGFEPYAHQRAVAAESEAKAISALNCPVKWFKMHFRKAGKRDRLIAEICQEAPGSVFELHFEECHRNGRIERDHHWIPVENLKEGLKNLRERKARSSEAKVVGIDDWRERIKNVPKPISLKATES